MHYFWYLALELRFHVELYVVVITQTWDFSNIHDKIIHVLIHK